MDILDDAVFESMKLKIVEALEQKSSQPKAVTAPEEPLLLVPAHHQDWSFCHTALKGYLTEDTPPPGVPLDALAYAAARIADHRTALTAAVKSIEADPTKVAAYYALAFSSCTAVPTASQLKSAERWLELSAMCPGEAKVYDEIKAIVDDSSIRANNREHAFVQVFLQDSKWEKFQRLYPQLAENEDVQAMFKSIREDPSNAFNLLRESPNMVTLASRLWTDSFSLLFLRDPIVSNPADHDSGSVISSLPKSVVNEIASFLSPSDLSCLKCTNDTMQVLFSGSTFKTAFLSAINLPIDSDPYDLFHGSFNGHEWETLYRMLMLVRRATSYLLDDLGMIPFDAIEAFIPTRRTVMSPANTEHIRELVYKHNPSLGRHYGLPMAQVIYAATDLLVLFKISKTALSCIFQDNYLMVVANFASAILTDRFELRAPIIEFISVASLSSSEMADYFIRTAVGTQVRFATKTFEEAACAVSAMTFNPRMREVFFQLTPITASMHSNSSFFPSPLPVPPASSSDVSSSPSDASVSQAAIASADVEPPTSLFRHKPLHSGAYQFWMRYGLLDYQVEVDTGLIELAIEGPRVNGKGCDTFRGAFKVRNMLPEKDLQPHSTLLPVAAHDHYLVVEYEDGLELILVLIPFPYGFHGTILTRHEGQALSFGNCMLLYNGMATQDVAHRNRLMKLPSPLEWTERALNGFDPMTYNRAAAAKKGELMKPWVPAAEYNDATRIFAEFLVSMRVLAEMAYSCSSPCTTKLALYQLGTQDVPEQGAPVTEDYVATRIGPFNPELESKGHYNARMAILKQIFGKLIRLRTVLLIQYGRLWGLSPGAAPSTERAIQFLRAAAAQHEEAIQQQTLLANRPYWINLLRITPADEISSTRVRYQLLLATISSAEYYQQVENAPQRDDGSTADTSTVLSHASSSDTAGPAKASKKRRGGAVPTWLLPTFAVAVVSISLGAFFLGRLLKPAKKSQ